MFQRKPMFRLLLFIGILALLSSCSLRKICDKNFPCSPVITTEVKDSLIHDTVQVFVPYQELSFDTASPCPPEINYHRAIKRDWITAFVDISNSQIHFFVKEDAHEKAIDVTVKQTTITKVKVVYKDKVVVQYEVKWYYELYKYGFWIMLLFILLAIIYALLKLKI